MQNFGFDFSVSSSYDMFRVLKTFRSELKDINKIRKFGDTFKDKL
jgi:hypothetical protein